MKLPKECGSDNVGPGETQRGFAFILNMVFYLLKNLSRGSKGMTGYVCSMKSSVSLRVT